MKHKQHVMHASHIKLYTHIHQSVQPFCDVPWILYIMFIIIIAKLLNEASIRDAL